MKKARIVFFGTPEFASYILAKLIEEKYEIVGVVTQPDKPVGRKKILTPSLVKKVAMENNIKVYQPISLRKDYDFLYDLDADLFISAAYGQILPHEVLNIAKINNINVHGSLLPKYRGGAPIQRAIINGDTYTGVCIMKMVDKMDAGCVYAKREVKIDINDNTTSLFAKMQEVGADLLLEVLPDIIENKLQGEIQDDTKATYAYNIKREEEKIDFNQNVDVVFNLIRALSLTPGAYCLYKGKQMKIFQAKIYSICEDSNTIGQIKIFDKVNLCVRCKNGYLQICELQIEGKQKMSASSFLNGCNKEELSRSHLT
ncbi:MAG: methionyl-tRNA formyltransferase [Erysipelotrichaceae bacterium]|nr:methionyl-tRNA formyltransferase [Erysipelotrichaceae bacterium]